MPAHLPVQLAHAIHLTAATDCKISHVEGLRSISRVFPSHRQEILNGNGKLIQCIVAEIGTNEIGIEAVESGTDRSVRSKDIPGPRDIHGKIKWLLVILHVRPGSFERGERCVAFIKMTYFRPQSQCSQQAPAANSKNDLLFQPHLCVAAVKLTGYPPVSRCIGKIVGIEQRTAFLFQQRLPNSGARSSNPEIESVTVTILHLDAAAAGWATGPDH